MKITTTLLALALFGCVAQVDVNDLGNAGDASVTNDASTTIRVPVSQISDGQWHRFTVDDSCHCAASQQAVPVACLQCANGSCDAFLQPGNGCSGCDDCFATCHSIYLTNLQAPVITFEFEYSCQ